MWCTMYLKSILFIAFCISPLPVKAFLCSVNGGPFFREGIQDLFIQVSPEVQPGENIIFDAGHQIFCRNEVPPHDIQGGADELVIKAGSMLSGPLVNAYKSSIFVSTGVYNLPVVTPFTAQLWADAQRDYFKLKTVLTPLGNDASGIVVKKGDKVATIHVQKSYKPPSGPNYDYYNYTWNLYSNNDVVVPTSTCDVNTRDVAIQLGDYPIDVSEKIIDIRVKCVQRQDISFYLSGATKSPTIFSNVETKSPAKGVGIEIRRNGAPVRVNEVNNIGMVGPSFTPLNLRAKYVKDGSSFKAGNVKSVIGVTFIFN